MNRGYTLWRMDFPGERNGTYLMKKHMILGLLAVCLLLALAPRAEALNSNIASGTCGDGISWSLDGYTLTVSGSGEMAEGSSWAEYKDHIKEIVFTGGVTKICDEAFSGCSWVRTVDFGDALVEIGAKAFYGCKRIEYIHLPATFRIFGAESFRDCTGLKYVYCDGGMPRFNDSCLWTGEYISVFYPTNAPWPQEYVSQLISNFGGRLGIMMGNFDAAAVEANLAELEAEETGEAEETEETEETEQTEAPTEPPTEAATEPATVPTTVPVTVPAETAAPAAVETTVPTTEAPPTTQAAETTEAPTETEPVTVAEKVGGDGWIGMVLIAAVLTLLLVGALVFRGARHKGGQYMQ